MPKLLAAAASKMAPKAGRGQESSRSATSATRSIRAANQSKSKPKKPKDAAAAALSEAMEDGKKAEDENCQWRQELRSDAADPRWRLAALLTSINVVEPLAVAMLGADVDSEHDELAAARQLGALGEAECKRTLLTAFEEALNEVVDAVWPALARLAKPGVLSTAEAAHDKFLLDGKGFTLQLGGLDKFYGGLEGIVGPPNPQLEKGMELDHCGMPDAATPFDMPNRRVTTTSTIEWRFVHDPHAGADGNGTPFAPYPNAESAREPLPFEHFETALAERNLRLFDAGHPPVGRCEWVGARLYTGPLYLKFNAVLRGLQFEFARGSFETLCLGNKYTTSIHVINSAIIKLSKLTVAARVYRGVSGGLLPDACRVANEFGVKGGVEGGFMSTTTDLETALFYARGGADKSKRGGPAILFESLMGMTSRGADIGWLSQFPHEAEILLNPLTGMEVRGSRLEGDVQVYELVLTVNMASLTIEEVVSKRRKVVVDMCNVMSDSLAHELAHAEDKWAPLKAALPDVDIDALAQAQLRKWLGQISADSVEVFNIDASLGAAIQAAVHTKAEVNGWPDGWRRLHEAAKAVDGELLMQESLELSGAGLGDSEAGAIALALATRQPLPITTLDLLGNHFSVRAAMHLTEVVNDNDARAGLSLVGTDLQHMSGKGLGDADMVMMGQSILSVSWRQAPYLGDSSVSWRQHLGDKLRVMALYGNKFGASTDIYGGRTGVGLSCLGRAASALDELEELHLDSNCIGNVDLSAFCRELPPKALPAMTVLGLSGNLISTVDALASAAESSGAFAGLRNLYLGYNQLNGEGAAGVLRIAEACPQLVGIDLQHNLTGFAPALTGAAASPHLSARVASLSNAAAATAATTTGSDDRAAPDLRRFSQPGGGEAARTSKRKLGVLLCDFDVPTITTAAFGYEVVFQVVPGLSFQQLASGHLTTDLEIVFQGCVTALQVQGCELITGGEPGFIHLEQRARARADVPIVMSAMSQSPIISAAIPANEKALVLTADEKNLKNFFQVDPSRFIVVDCNQVPGFEEFMLGESLDYDRVAPHVIWWATYQLENHGVSMFLIEPAQLLPFADRLRAVLRVPVIDSTTIRGFLDAGYLQLDSE